MSHAKQMWDTAVATEHSAKPASASDCRLPADDAAATEHSKLSANAIERHTTAPALPMHRRHCHAAACTATEHAATAAVHTATTAATATERTEAAANCAATEHAQQAEALMQTESQCANHSGISSISRASLWTTANRTNAIPVLFNKLPSEAIAAHRLHPTPDCVPHPIDI